MCAGNSGSVGMRGLTGAGGARGTWQQWPDNAATNQGFIARLGLFIRSFFQALVRPNLLTH